MERRILSRKLFCAISVLFFALFLLLSCHKAAAEEFQSAYFTIYFTPDLNLRKIYVRLQRRAFFVNTGLPRPDSFQSTEEKIGYRLDILLERAKEVLNIYPAGMGLKIMIYKTRSELNDEYYRISKVRANVKSFYAHKNRTIYISEDVMSDSIMAHEMGHALIDNYFKVVPPENIGEMLATYVDLHLGD